MKIGQPEIRIKLEEVKKVSHVLDTLPAEMFGGSDFWMETMVIIKISTYAWYLRTFDFLSAMYLQSHF